MDTEKAPRAWIGEKVSVVWGRDPERVPCVLIDVVPEGIVIESVRAVEAEGKAYEGTVHALIPWNALGSIYKVVGLNEKDAQAEDAE